MSHGIAADGRCKACGGAIAGRFDGETRAFGPRRIPVRLANYRA
jgi:hypothetical protein